MTPRAARVHEPALSEWQKRNADYVTVRVIVAGTLVDPETPVMVIV